MLEQSINTLNDFFLNPQIILFGILIISTVVLFTVSLVIRKTLFIKLNVDPIHCLSGIKEFNQDWYVVVADYLFREFEKFNLGKDVYEEFISQIPKSILNSFVARLTEAQRVRWKKKIFAAPEKTEVNEFKRFMIKAFLNSPDKKEHCDLLFSLLTLSKPDFDALVLHDDCASEVIQRLVRPSFTKAIFKQMSEEQFKKSVQNVFLMESGKVGMRRTTLTGAELRNLKNKIKIIKATPASSIENTGENAFVYFLSSNKEKILYRELNKCGQVNTILSLLNLKIPFGLLTIYPSSLISEFLKLSDDRLASYFATYSEEERKILFQKGMMEGARRVKIELQIRDNLKSRSEKVKDMQDSMKYLENLYKNRQDWELSFQEYFREWNSNNQGKPSKISRLAPVVPVENN